MKYKSKIEEAKRNLNQKQKLSTTLVSDPSVAVKKQSLKIHWWTLPKPERFKTGNYQLAQSEVLFSIAWRTVKGPKYLIGSSPTRTGSKPKV